eukprot:PITA_35935
MEHTNNGVPLFKENNYALWKGRMEVYLLVQGYEVWDVVQNGFTPTADEQGKKNLVNDAKAKNIIISGLTKYAYHKVLGCKTAKNVWDKLENIYASDSNVKEAKLQIYRAKFEQIRMKEDVKIIAYFQHGKFKGKLPLICFGCGEVGHFAAKCKNRSDGNSKGNKVFKKFNKEGKKKGFKRNYLSKEDCSSSDEDGDSEEEANERVLFMAKHNKQRVSNNEEEWLTIEEFSKEAIKLRNS